MFVRLHLTKQPIHKPLVLMQQIHSTHLPFRDDFRLPSNIFYYEFNHGIMFKCFRHPNFKCIANKEQIDRTKLNFRYGLIKVHNWWQPQPNEYQNPHPDQILLVMKKYIRYIVRLLRCLEDTMLKSCTPLHFQQSEKFREIVIQWPNTRTECEYVPGKFKVASSTEDLTNIKTAEPHLSDHQKMPVL